MAVSVRPMDLQTEAEFQAQVIEMARLFGWEVYHTHNSQRSTSKGFPDLVLIKSGRLIFAELKNRKGKVTTEQNWWLDQLKLVAQANSTIEVYLWRPTHWDECLKVIKS